MLLIGVFALVMMLAAPAQADPVSAIILGAISASLAASPVAVAITTAVITMAVSMALSYVASALLKPAGKSGAGGAGVPDTSLNSKQSVRQATAPLQVVYGRTKVGGVYADLWVGNGNQNLYGALVLGGHEFDAIEDIYLGDQLTGLADPLGGVITSGRYAGNGYIYKHTGPANQAAAQYLVENSNGRWTYDHRLRGLPYIGFAFYWDNTTGTGNPFYGNFVVSHLGAKLWSGGLPNITCVVRGKKIYDPRTGQTAWSNNSALVVADYLCDKTFGLGVDYATGIDETALIAAANACDEMVTRYSGGTEKRYTTDGFFKVDGTPDAILGRLLGAMHGSAIYDGERWVIQAGVYQEPDSVVLTDDDMRAASTLQTLTSTRDISNGVKGTYVGEETSWQPADFPAIQSSTFITDDGGVEKWRDIELPFSSTASRCMRLAKIDLLKQRYETVETFKGKLSCWRYRAGQTVLRTSDRYGWTNKPFTIGSVRVVPDEDAEGNPLIGIDLTLYETDPSIYNWSTSEETPIRAPTSPTLPDLYNVQPPTGFTATESTYTTEGGQGIKSKVLLAWTAPEDALVTLGGYYMLQYKLSSASAWSSLPDTTNTTAEVLDVKPATYNYRIRSVNYAGNPSAWISTTLTVSGDTTPPEDVVGFTNASGVSGFTTFSWTAAVNERARNGSAEIRYSSATSGATWAGSTAIVAQAALNTTATVQTKIGTYLIKYKSANGIYSVNAASSVVTTTAQPKVGIEIVDALPTTDLFNGRLVYLTTDGKLYRYVTGTGWTTAVPAADLSGFLASSNFPTNLRPVELVTVLPTTGNFEGRVVYLTTDDKLYRYTGSAWTAAVPAADITGQITTTQISDDSISTPKLKANSVTANELAANSVTASKVLAGAISTAALAANAVTAEKMFIGDTNNYVSNPTMALGAANWGTGNAASYLTYVDGLPTGVTMTAGNGYAGSGYHIAVASGAAAFIAQNANRFAVTAGDLYLLRATVQRVSTPNQTLYVGLRFVNASGTEVTVTTGSQALSWTSSSSTSYSTQTIAADSIVVPSGAVWAFAVIYTTGTLSGGSYRVGEVSVLKKAGGSLIVDGSIVADKLATNAVTADKITAGAVTAAKISVSQLSALSADLGSVTAGTVTGATIQTASSGVRSIMDGTRNMIRTEDPLYTTRTWYRSLGAGFPEPNVIATIGADGANAYSRVLNYQAIAAFEGRSFGNTSSPSSTPGAVGVVGYGDWYGLYGNSPYNAGVVADGVVYDFYAGGTGSNYGPFTGTHDAIIPKDGAAEIGDIVVDVEVVAQKSISNAITSVERSSVANQPGALGVVSLRQELAAMAPPIALTGERDPDLKTQVIAPEFAGLPDTHDRLLVNAVGEGLINVCGQGGDIAIGDLIVTSDMAGKGMRQADDIVRGYTVAKARETATFATAGEVKTIACIYVSG